MTMHYMHVHVYILHQHMKNAALLTKVGCHGLSIVLPYTSTNSAMLVFASAFAERQAAEPATMVTAK